MTKSEIEALIVSALRSVEQQSGRPESMLSPITCPVGDMPDFDSLNAVEATTEVLDALGLDTKFNNIFADGEKSLNIGEAAERLLKCIGAEP